MAMDKISNNKELIQAVNDAIQESGYKKMWIAEQLGISNQNFHRLLQKKSFSLDDANKILSIIGYESITNINKKDLKK